MKRKTTNRTPLVTLLRIAVIVAFLLGAAALIAAFAAALPAAAMQQEGSGSYSGTGTDIPSSPVTESERVIPEAADWQLVLVNPWNTLPGGYEITTVQLKNGHSVDERCYPDLQEMMDACRESGLSPLICSSYRSWEDQQQLYQNQVSRLLAAGYVQAEAEAEAGKVVALPGTSEHQLGLAVDIVDESNQRLDASQENTAVQQWLMQNSWKYGFILRYPADKSDITGIVYEPWHYRYVGRDAAREIYEQDICLEEYRSTLQSS